MRHLRMRITRGCYVWGLLCGSGSRFQFCVRYFQARTQTTFFWSGIFQVMTTQTKTDSNMWSVIFQVLGNKNKILSSAGAVALGGRKGRDRASIEASVAVATLFYGTSGSVCAHACVLCVSSCVCCVCTRSETKSKNRASVAT